jgi:hypothetical protein
MAGAAFGSVASGATWNVPGNFPTIQAAINGSANGDTIIVAPGSYRTKIDFNGKAVVLRSSGGPNVTTINATGQSGTVVRFGSGETNNSVLEGFTLTGGIGHLIGGRRRGGGIVCDMSSPIVKTCIIISNTADDGGAIYNFFNSAKFYNCLIVNNTASNGGAVYNDVANPIFTNCTVSRNVGSLGGGFWGNNGSTPRLTSCIVHTNTGDSFAGTGSRIVTYSCIQGGSAGMGNIDTNPQFVNGAAGDFRLTVASPCVDAGDSEALAFIGVAKDVGNLLRLFDYPSTPDAGVPVYGMVIDMGAHELQFACQSSCPGDIVGTTNQVDIDDLFFIISHWGVCP